MIPSAASDAALLREFSEAGTDGAFRQLIERHARLVFDTCYRILGNADSAENAAQSTFVALALKAPRLDASRGPGGGRHRVARQTSLEMRKAAQRRRRREQEAGRRSVKADAQGNFRLRVRSSSAFASSRLDASSGLRRGAVRPLPRSIRG